MLTKNITSLDKFLGYCSDLNAGTVTEDKAIMLKGFADDAIRSLRFKSKYTAMPQLEYEINGILEMRDRTLGAKS